MIPAKKRGNLVLTGMPGSGKSTVSRRVAKALNREWYDADAVIEKEAGLSINEIFEKFGEDYFRALETKCLIKLLMRENTVIATGGGAILNNAGLLKENALVVYLERDLEGIISTMKAEKRPLVKDNPGMRIRELYEKRKSFYESGCDILITNNAGLNDAVKKITEAYYAYFSN